MSDRTAHRGIVTLTLLSLLLLAASQLAWPEGSTANAPGLGQPAEQVQQIHEPGANADETEPATSDPDGKTETVKGSKPKKPFSIRGYTQVRYNSFELSEDGAEPNEGFDVRRAKLKLALRPTDRWRTVVELGASDSRIELEDAYAEIDLLRKRKLAIGQTKWPFGYDVTSSSGDREAPERTLVFRRLFPGQQDRGITLEGRLGNGMSWIMGLFDGTGTQEVNTEIRDMYGQLTDVKSRFVTHDYNSHKDIVGRLTWENGNAEYGVSSYVGKGIWNKKRTEFLDVWKNRYGAEFRYTDDKWALKTEYVRGRGVDEFDKDFGYSDWVSGYYAQYSYNLNPTSMLVARYSSMSQDPNEPQFGRRSAWDVGWLKWLNDTTRIRLFYQINRESEEPIDNDGFLAEWMVVY